MVQNCPRSRKSSMSSSQTSTFREAIPATPLPHRFRDYEIVRRIAAGGMSEILEARPKAAHGLGPSVVLKCILPTARGEDEALARFALYNEATLLGRLKHPNLVQLLGYDLEGMAPYLALEYIDGVSLADLMSTLRATNRILPAPLALLIVEQLLDALTCVHEACDAHGVPLGIVHRDVTPRNVLLGLDGRVALSDFGIARSDAHFEPRPAGVVLKGTVRYFSPEQAAGHAIDTRSDLYSVGIVLFELLTGTRYLQGRNEHELLHEAARPPVRRPSAVSTVDPIVDYLTLRALNIAPEERYPNARSFRAAVSALRSTHLSARQEDLAEFVHEITHGRRQATRKGRHRPTAQAMLVEPATPRKWLPTILAIVGLLAFGAALGFYVAFA